MNEEQLNEMGSRRGFIAALDQSGGSTPKALALYGIPETAYGNEGQMFDLMHEARARLIESPSFTGDKILATILFEQTLDRTINGEDTVAFLWKQKHIVPFVKVDQGLADAQAVFARTLSARREPRGGPSDRPRGRASWAAG